MNQIVLTGSDKSRQMAADLIRNWFSSHSDLVIKMSLEKSKWCLSMTDGETEEVVISADKGILLNVFAAAILLSDLE